MTTIRSSARPSLLRQINLQEIVAAIQAHGPLSRAELSRFTGISGPTVTRAVSTLIVANLLEEGEFQRSAVGRPGKVVRLASTAVSVLGAVVGAQRCELVASGLDGEIRPGSIRHFATPARYADLVKSFVRHARDLMGDGRTTVLGLGLSMPGLLDCRTGGTIVSPNVPQTNGRRLGDDLRDELSLETTVLQECSALCVAEQVYGAARGATNFAMLDISEGLGLGVMHEGRILEGHSGLAGELGHMTVDIDGRACRCGNQGCLETVATDRALTLAICERLGRNIDVDELIPLIQSSEISAEREVERVLAYLAVGLAAVINIFNPQKVFIYGRLLDIGDSFEKLLELTRRRTLAPSFADCEVIRARGSKRLGVIAAAIQSLTRDWNKDVNAESRMKN